MDRVTECHHARGGRHPEGFSLLEMMMVITVILIVASAHTQATSGTYCWGQSFGYDRYANLQTATVTQCTAPMLSLSVNTNNQITNSGFTYDASGDMTSDGTYTYAWDARNRLQSAGGVSYTYDGDGKRVMKSSGTLYWNWPDGTPLAETNSSGTTLNEYIFFYGNRIARRDSSGNVYYYFLDQVGTTKTLTTSAGVVCYDADFLPFGGERPYTTSCSQNYKFTGLERDGETGNDHTLYRMYDSSLGRWLSSGPAGLGAVDPSNPQSWNRYAFVLNDPPTLAGQGDANLQADFNSVSVSHSGAAIIMANTLSGMIHMSSAVVSDTSLCPGCTLAANGKLNQNSLGVPPISGFSTALMEFLGVPLYDLPSSAIDRSEQAALYQIAQAIMNGKASAAPAYPDQTFSSSPLDIGESWNTAYYNFLELFASINPSTILVEQSAACYEGNPAACGDTTDAAVFQAFMNGPWGGSSEAMGWGASPYPAYWCIGRICRPTF